MNYNLLFVKRGSFYEFKESLLKFSNEVVIFVELLDSILNDNNGGYSDDIPLLDNVEYVEDDI